MKQASQAKRSPLKIAAIVLAVVVVIVYVTAALAIGDIARGRDLGYNARSYLSPAERGRYDTLYETALLDMGKSAEYSAEVEECRALAFYYEQAVLEHAYRVAGNDAKADEFATRMSEYETELGSMAGKAADVRAFVEG